MRRANKGMDPERRVVCGIAAVVAVVVASVAFFGWRACGRSVDAVGVDGAAIELKVNLRCDGWSSENTGLGVFVSGTQIDGATCDEVNGGDGASFHLCFSCGFESGVEP